MMRRKIAPLAAVGVLVAAILAALVVACDKGEVRLLRTYITANSYKVAPGDTTQMTLRPYPEDANAGFPDAVVEWSSSDTSVAAVSPAGVFSALKYGQVVVTAVFGRFVAERQMTVSSVATFADPLLSRFLVERFDTNADGLLEGFETANVAGLDLTDLSSRAAGAVVDMSGLESFVNIQTLRVERLNMSGLDLRKFSRLRELHLDTCGVESVDLRLCHGLTDVRIMACRSLREVLLGSYADYGPNNLRTLHVARCDIEALDLSRCGATLWDIDVAGNPRLASLDLSADTMLHSAYYTCGSTAVTWPAGVELDEVIRPACE